jgi:hypothetical protein
MSKFPEYSGASFSEVDVENYLEELADEGWRVFKHRNEYIVVIDDERRISTWYAPRDKEWHVDTTFIEGTLGFSPNPVVNFQQFKSCFAQAAKYLGEDLDDGPKSIRFKEATPVSNKVSIANITCNNEVNCIFDPYFVDKSISTLTTLVNLGMSLKNDVRVLTTSKIKSRLSPQMISDFKKEKDVNLDIRFCRSNKEHRRYLLLATGESLVIGCSLNSLDKNEAAHIENSQEDRNFFEEQWQVSLPI